MISKMMITALAVGLTIGVTADEKVKVRKQLSTEQKTKLAAIKANKSSKLETAYPTEMAAYKSLLAAGKKKEAAAQLRKVRKLQLSASLDAHAVKYPTEVAYLKALLASDTEQSETAFRQAYHALKKQLRQDQRQPEPKVKIFSKK